MITKLDNTNKEIADQIFTVFQRSYRIEALIIGALDFPPLSRTIKDIEVSKTQFYGFIEDSCPVAIIEIVKEGRYLEINSLTVLPASFGKGIASKLIRFVLELIDFKIAVVETATATYRQ